MHKYRYLILSLFQLSLLICLKASQESANSGTQSQPNEFLEVNIDHIGYEKLKKLKSVAEDDGWWLELGRRLLICTNNKQKLVSQLGGYLLGDLEAGYRKSEVMILYDIEMNKLEDVDKNVLIMKGYGFFIVQGLDEQMLQKLKTPDSLAPKLIPLNPNSVLVRQHSNDPDSGGRDNDPIIQELVNHVSATRWLNHIRVLEAFNRYTKGNDITNAMNWILAQLKNISDESRNGKLQISTQQFAVGTTIAYNIIAKLEGTNPNSWYIVGGHYDSTSQSPTVKAPGAEDNASGSAGVLEMLIAFTSSSQVPQSSIYFIFFSGEEQGLYGSTANAIQIVQDGNKDKVQFVINMDMIGYQAPGHSMAVLLETNQKYESYLDDFFNAAVQYTNGLQIEYSFNPFGSDHVPYLNRGMPALLTIDNDYASYPAYHKTTDEDHYLTKEIAQAIVRMNVAALAKKVGY